ncbi:wax ester/triacylglycerol synthase family O-acyltransferase [Mycobacterium sp. CBMA293]|uniref:WS/DGAT/MGAT family O-acyltransferase n=3 Tax=Mycolicibacterium TaxID=1866885 RepID=UPI001327EDFE|nr:MULTISPECIES: wax ester/triacylglycerol synthase family O-acyltransferase [unclassified Mycolicibacterium]MUL47390.1 wax ester/triacylglycerol synthase family O-acyltransferase [Mycolicibacterium sp. CBMA 360]MUL94743.1 wax ester/triacylglycerol synthase family O-acyltransferase [Mycolicibacterium sp. CBMA 230]MUL59375.1 wax ester/triacylglycerol synthase family O-acyltransferase [Mycolicibacterium sp. CBMA 335]MUL71100.1 wax ester/triacylglycerol synthase family O-acyltransferase [Mycolicib
MEMMSPLDAMFLLTESREHPMHVAGLQLFTPPDGAGPEFVHELYQDMLAHTHFSGTYRKRPARVLGGVANFGWSYDDEVDVDYHLRRSALPAPGRVRELLELTSRLHTSLLDRHRPLWETYLVEGLEDGRFAVYSKTHHALVDGISALRLTMRTLSEDPAEAEVRVPWDLPSRKRDAESESVLKSAMGAVSSALGLGPSTLRVARTALFEQQYTAPFNAPRTMFNVKIGGARRVAAQSWPVARIKAVKQAAGSTVNDVVLAMCAGALRGYLMEQDALPDAPLVAMVPVSLRSEADVDAGGNQVGAVLCNLATDLKDPAARLAAISESMRGNKEVLAGLSKTESVALSALLLAPTALANVPGFIAATPPPFNIVISNVPGPRVPMYWKGARLDGNYPLSIALDGQALNITLVNNGGNLDFGLVGCRHTVPHLQRLLGHLEDSLADLEAAVR